MQLELPGIPALPRPSKEDLEVKQECIKFIANLIKKEDIKSNCCILQDEEYARIGSCLLNELTYTLDGYELAKYLEKTFDYKCDKQIVDLLDDLHFYVEDIYSKKVKEWVKINNIKPELEIGTKVKYKFFNNKFIPGTITKIYEDKACYCILSENMQSSNCSSKTLGILIPYEEVQV